MACFGYCLIGFIFIGIMAAFAFSSKDSKEMKAFNDSLDQDKKEEYKKIIRERAIIYFQGLIIGLTLGIIFLTLLKGNKTIPLSQKVCIFLVVALGVNYMHYMAVPKTKYMLDLDLTAEQSKAWLQVYKSMKSRQFIGALVGIMGYIVFSYGYCC